MAGTVFLQAQYLQFVLDYTPLAAGFALVPAAIGMVLGTGAGAHLAEMHGGRIAVTAGTLIFGQNKFFIVGALYQILQFFPSAILYYTSQFSFLYERHVVLRNQD